MQMKSVPFIFFFETGVKLYYVLKNLLQVCIQIRFGIQFILITLAMCKRCRCTLEERYCTLIINKRSLCREYLSVT